ncbi:lanthionine synthetase C family protein [Streptomyces sp. NRRL B-24720]|uniref:lanthionine synthetase C family protein n=1 Tax=Streptomyces sp. NRRL B-24720 TaxID=1476876 RepID=UPI00099DC517|nr:lanthionine synthetase C family protein [Streptomyces sp. NRRL B-24720]
MKATMAAASASAADKHLPTHSMRARAVADTLADRLQDPHRVPFQRGTDEANPAHIRWRDVGTLGRGHAGISLLFSSRAQASPAHLATAHRHLQQAAKQMNDLPHPLVGLFGHVAGLGFAMTAARAATGGYTKALNELDRHITNSARALCAAVKTPGPRDLDQFDVISGLTGIGRYLLLRGEPTADTLTHILDTLAYVAVQGPAPGRPASATQLPGFWAAGAPSGPADNTSDLARNGHLNLGLSHGIAGPLALLSLAKEQGYGCERQSEAVERLADLLTTWLQHDEYGPFWPDYLTRHEFLSGTAGPSRRSVRWCYGSPGVSRALQLAGRSHGRRDWLSVADDTVAALLAAPRSNWVLPDMGLCHGWAGVLHLLGYFADGPNHVEVRTAMDEIAERVIDAFDVDATFGYRVAFTDPLKGGDYPGLLEGAAGIALSLDSYASGATHSFPWDAALMTA